jgi:transcriptional regulator with XRE-family HTH domain
MERDIQNNQALKISLSWDKFVDEAIRRRKSKGLTQDQLSVIAGVSKPTLGDFEKKRQTISLENAIKILKVLGLD